jgi:hypothetical protein
MEPQKTTRRWVILHRGVTLRDATVYLSGHAYHNCRFERCTLVVRESNFSCTGCSFEACTFHLDMVLHDRIGLENLRDITVSLLEGVLREEGVVTEEERPSSGVGFWPLGGEQTPEEGRG